MTDKKPAPKQAEPGVEKRLDPFEIEFLPHFRQNRGPEEPFVNQHGVMIGDHEYESGNSPLTNWTRDTDPAVMAGPEWVHPFKDVGFHTEQNRDYFEKGILPDQGFLMHPFKDAAYQAYNGPVEEEGDPSVQQASSETDGNSL